jgi:hypothetical protein
VVVVPFHGPTSVSKLAEFSPDFKFGYELSPKIGGGLEYDGAPATGFDPPSRPSNNRFFSLASFIRTIPNHLSK